MEKRTIWLKPTAFSPEITMCIPVSDDLDAEECISEFLDSILCEDIKYSARWSFCDGIS